MSRSETPSDPKGLSPRAYVELAPGEQYEPFVSSESELPEFTLKAALLGIFFGIVFGAANAYLGLRAGLTISTSIPVAVMTVAAFKALETVGKGGSILEANMSQTIGSASSSLASGVIFTLPALFLWGVAPDLLQMTLLAMCGGVIGILFMIPLRRFLIKGEHGRLPYPEGTACAEVLVASKVGGQSAKFVFLGLGLGAFFKFLTSWIKVIPDEVATRLPFIKKGEIGMDLSAALFGVGYILGPRIATVMVGGSLLAWVIIIPAIAVWGDGFTVPVFPESVALIHDMSPSQIWTRYVRYIGAGAVATAGIVTLIRSIPVMVQSFRIGASELRDRVSDGAEAVEKSRTDDDLPLKFVGFGLLAIVLVLALVPQVLGDVGGMGIRLVAAVCIVVFAFFFVTVASRIVGLVGVTSNPTSGMTIASLLGTAGIFLVMGWTDLTGKAAALTVGCVVAIAASIAGDTSQDLKTGYLLGATPRRQQMGELIGVLSSATFVCLSVILLAKTFGFGTQELPAPQATLMKLVIEGVLDQQLPWMFVGIGIAIALACEVLKIPSLPFAVGVYLPVSTLTPIFVGGLLRGLFERSAKSEEDLVNRRERGVLLGSGFVGGEGLLGVGIAAVAFVQNRKPDGIGMDWLGNHIVAEIVGLIVFGFLIAGFSSLVRRRSSA
ncbi:MAG: oligopeptide transporter, OPT family [Gammaproteobacteria bacterium]|nr:oligopeptide transporter, OPT family [Gammaproteobacteria bacterium]MDH4313795.1 oligopeptide transporter, OPT family [Gammaproteobacteria bacterium]MDH5215169.1 oligopeptide transporter, OPT family [Gammaproteobacteria bacterium]MDH5500135.1 oligopeptide transporter, OPT family [Gammaproteobacteria bacterium]